jgi:hypothetical protein
MTNLRIGTEVIRETLALETNKLEREVRARTNEKAAVRAPYVQPLALPRGQVKLAFMEDKTKVHQD